MTIKIFKKDRKKEEKKTKKNLQNNTIPKKRQD